MTTGAFFNNTKVFFATYGNLSATSKMPSHTLIYGVNTDIDCFTNVYTLNAALKQTGSIYRETSITYYHFATTILKMPVISGSGVPTDILIAKHMVS